MTVWRQATALGGMGALIAISLAFGLFSNAAVADHHDLPPIDWNAIERAAQKVNQREPYISSLPARRHECVETARPFAHSISINAWFNAAVIKRVCLRAMILKLTEIYGGPDGITAPDMARHLDWISDAVSELKHREAGGGVGGCDMDELCTGVDWVLEGEGDHIRFLAEIVAAIAVRQAKETNLPEFDTDRWIEAWEKAGKF